MTFLKKARIFTTIFLFCIAGWFLFTYRLLEVPPGINGDEAVIGYNAALVSRNGLDSNNNFLPLFTSVPKSNDWKQPVTFYAEILAFKIFGPSYFTLRAVSVFFALLSGSLIFLLINELLGFKTALAGLAIFLTIPIVMIQSHLALENIAPVPFISFWLWMIIKYSKQLKLRYLVLAAIALSVGLYSYLGLRLIVPSLAVLTIIFVYYLSQKSFDKVRKGVFIFILIILAFFALFLNVKDKYPGSFLGQYRPYGVTAYQQFLLPYLSSFDPTFLFIKGDVTPYHSTGKQGMFLLGTLPLFVYGIVKIIKNNKSIQTFILASFFLTPILFGLASDTHRASRLLTLIPFYTIVASIGGVGMIEKVNFKFKKKIISFTLISFLAFLIMLNYVDFLRDYWFEYPLRVKAEFSRPFNLAFERAQELARQHNLTPLIQDDFRVENPIAVDFFETIYFPKKLKRWKTDQTLPKSSLVIVNYSEDMKKIPSEKIKGTEFGILTNY